jgi:hypothetical protein
VKRFLVLPVEGIFILRPIGALARLLQRQDSKDHVWLDHEGISFGVLACEEAILQNSVYKHEEMRYVVHP